MEFWPTFYIFHRLRPYLSSKRVTLGFYKQATHKKPGDEAFFYFEIHRSQLGMAQKWSILDQIWPNMAGLSTFQSGPKGPKKNQNGQPKCFWPFGTLTKFCYHMEFLKFLHGFVKVVTCISRPLPNKNKLKFDIDSFVGLKSLINLMPGVCCAFGNVWFTSWPLLLIMQGRQYLEWEEPCTW